MSPTYGPRFDETGVQHAPAANAAEYSLELPLYHRRIGNGTVYCRMLKSPHPGRRIVQLVAEYSDAGVPVQQVVQCDSEADEARQLERLERIITAASAKAAVQ